MWTLLISLSLAEEIPAGAWVVVAAQAPVSTARGNVLVPHSS